MSKATVTVNDWTAMFRDIGLDEDTMWQWHGIFEQRHPEAHEDFLHWLQSQTTGRAGGMRKAPKRGYCLVKIQRFLPIQLILISDVGSNRLLV